MIGWEWPPARSHKKLSRRADDSLAARRVRQRISPRPARAAHLEKVRKPTDHQGERGSVAASFVWSAGVAADSGGRAIRAEDFSLRRRAASGGSVRARPESPRDTARNLSLRRRWSQAAGNPARSQSDGDPEIVGWAMVVPRGRGGGFSHGGIPAHAVEVRLSPGLPRGAGRGWPSLPDVLPDGDVARTRAVLHDGFCRHAHREGVEGGWHL